VPPPPVGAPPPPVGPPPGPGGAYIPPPGGGGGGSWFADNRNWLLPVGGVLLVLVLVGGFLAFSGDEAGADEIFLEPVDFEGEDPFTDSVSTTDGAAAGAVVVEDGPQVDGSVNGSEEGLYGGTLNASLCDREQLVGFLGDNADKARAFADVLDIDTDEIPDYVEGLTPVILRGDTRVTNHGFRDGEATSFQAVLQAGTAVLVDNQGIPRVKCYCGNPLTEPIAVDSPSYGGNRWDGFDPANVQVTFVDVDIDIFVLTDVDTGDLFTRPSGTDGSDDQTGTTGNPPDDTTPPPETTAPLGTGDVQVTLQWGGGVDLDVHVIDPNGDEIYYASRTSPSGGQLDQDALSDCSGCVENIFWPSGGAPPGEYQVFVVNFTGDPVTSYSLDIRVGGEIIASPGGSVGGGSPQSETTTFTVS
jgi:hypothetical protein